MREYATPPVRKGRISGSLSADVLRLLDTAPETILFRHERNGRWHDVSARQFRDQVVAVAKGLLASGIAKGDRVILLSRTRFEWTLADYACWWVGAVPVPVYQSSPAEHVAAIVADCGPAIAVVETAAHAEHVLAAGDGTDRLPVWVLNERGIHRLTAAGTTVSDDALEERRRSVGPDDLASIVYTPGTTGRPRGCCLTHGNFATEVDGATAVLPELFDEPGSGTLLFLPLAHVLARVVQVGCVRTGTSLGHLPDSARLDDVLAEFRPTFLLVVPKTLQRLVDEASRAAHAEGHGRRFDAAAATAIAYSKALDHGRPSLLLRLRRRLFERLVYASVRARLGGQVRHLVSGGGPVGERLGHFYRGIGMPVLEGYGLTETTAAVSVNVVSDIAVGTGGQPLPGTTVRIAEDGELLVRGGQVFAGYWGDQQETDRAVVDGWLHTGDVGEIDAAGNVTVTGRKHEILVTAGGKRVAPTVLEAEIRRQPLVSHCLVVGDGRPYVAALVTLDVDALAGWAEQHGRVGRRADRLHEDPRVRAEVQTAIDAANAMVSPAEAVRRFAVLPADWTEEDGYLTPTLTLRRALVVSDFRADIDALYD